MISFKGLAKSVGVYIMDNMLGENKNIKDTPQSSQKDTSAMSANLSNGSPSVSLSTISHWHNFSGSYKKTDKLVTALYMVTDTMEKEEPMRLKLRTLGTEILSDIHNISKTIPDLGRIEQVLSFLNIAYDLHMISEMNHSILKKEFLELRKSINEFKAHKNNWLPDFMLEPAENFEQEESSISYENELNSSNGHKQFKTLSFIKGHSVSPIKSGTRIGVQKGSTLLTALNKVATSKVSNGSEGKEAFENLKNKRREEVIAIIKEKKNTTGIDGATITDIRNMAKGALVSCGEKTLQRELVSMVSDRILYRTGSKRWSNYFIVAK